MTPARAAALEAVPVWVWAVGAEAAWQEKLAALRAYVGAHGRMPPHDHPSGLGEWVGKQRDAKRAAGAASSSRQMTPDRAAALEAVPGWAWDARRRTAAPATPPAERAK
jgi:hypothetical protein